MITIMGILILTVMAIHIITRPMNCGMAMMRTDRGVNPLATSGVVTGFTPGVGF